MSSQNTTQMIQQLLQNKSSNIYSIINHSNQYLWYLMNRGMIESGKFQLKYLNLNEFAVLEGPMQVQYLERQQIQIRNDKDQLNKLLTNCNGSMKRAIQHHINKQTSKFNKAIKHCTDCPIKGFKQITMAEILSGQAFLEELSYEQIHALTDDDKEKYFIMEQIQQCRIHEISTINHTLIKQANKLPKVDSRTVLDYQQYTKYIGQYIYSYHKLFKHYNEKQWFEIDCGISILKGYQSLSYLSTSQIQLLPHVDRARYLSLEKIQHAKDDPSLMGLFGMPFVNDLDIDNHRANAAIFLNNKIDGVDDNMLLKSPSNKNHWQLLKLTGFNGSIRNLFFNTDTNRIVDQQTGDIIMELSFAISCNSDGNLNGTITFKKIRKCALPRNNTIMAMKTVTMMITKSQYPLTVDHLKINSPIAVWGNYDLIWFKNINSDNINDTVDTKICDEGYDGDRDASDYQMETAASVCSKHEWFDKPFQQKKLWIARSTKCCSNPMCLRKKYYLNKNEEIIKRKFFRCKKCRNVMYCCRSCQKRHWIQSHSNICKK